MNADPDRIAADDDPDAGARALRQARGTTVVLMAPNIWLPLADAEVYALTAANQGSSTYVIGWRKARGSEEMAPHWQRAWSGDLSELEGRGEPWCWGVRITSGLGDLRGLLDSQFGPYEQDMARAQAAEAARAAQAAEAARPAS